MKFSTLLLAGVSIAALSTAPAFARMAPGIHAASRGATLVKSHVRDPKAINYTQTQAFSATISTATAYKVKTSILADTWYDSNTAGTTCSFPAKESWKKLPKKTAYAKIGQTSYTGTLAGCPAGDIATYHEILYTLTTKKAAGSSDVVTGTLTAPKWKVPNGTVYNLYLNVTVDVSITS